MDELTLIELDEEIADLGRFDDYEDEDGTYTPSQMGAFA